MGEAAPDRRGGRGRVGLIFPLPASGKRSRKRDRMQRTKPPFRADHVGSFLRTAAIKTIRRDQLDGVVQGENSLITQTQPAHDLVPALAQGMVPGRFREPLAHPGINDQAQDGVRELVRLARLAVLSAEDLATCLPAMARIAGEVSFEAISRSRRSTSGESRSTRASAALARTLSSAS